VQFEKITSDTDSGIEALALDYANAKADQAELDVLRAYFLLALSKMPDQTMRVSLSEQAQLGELPLQLQAKADKSGAVYIRAVEVK
jgi:hypothetical protein